MLDMQNHSYHCRQLWKWKMKGGGVNNICCVRRVKSQNETINSLGANSQNDPKMELSNESKISVPSH